MLASRCAALVAACLAKDPDRRRPAAGRLLRDLTGTHPGDYRTDQSSPPPPDGRQQGRHSAGRSTGQPGGRSGAPPAGQSTAPPAAGPSAARAGGQPSGRAGEQPARRSGRRGRALGEAVTPAGQVAGFRTQGGAGESDTGPAALSGFARRRSLRGLSRRPVLAVAALAVVLAVTSGLLIARSASGGGTAAAAQPGAGLDLEAFPNVDVTDRFDADTSANYITYQPGPAEALPAIDPGGGRFTGTGSAPFFGLVAGPGTPSSDVAVSVLTVGTFAGTGDQEDSVFVGWVKDGNSYVTAWYNNTRKDSGSTPIDGSFVATPGEASLSLKAGDRFSLELSGDTVTSYAQTGGGAWRMLRTATIGGALSTPQARRQYRYGFGLPARPGRSASAAPRAAAPASLACPAPSPEKLLHAPRLLDTIPMHEPGKG